MTTRLPHDNTEALHAYLATKLEAEALLAGVAALLDEHQDSLTPDEIHWGHVGDLRRILQGLKDILGNV